MTHENLRRIDLNMVERIILSLYESGSEKRTTISRNAKMSYDKCMKYLNYLEQINFVKKEVDDQNTIVYSITNDGINLCKNKLYGKSELNYSHIGERVLTSFFL